MKGFLRKFVPVAVLLGSALSALAAQSAIGSPAPDFAFQLPSGLHGSISDLKGSVLVLDFWNSGSAASMQELAEVNQIDQNNDNVLVIGIDSEDTATTDKITSDQNIGFHTLPDADKAISGLYAVTTTPRVVVVDAKGNISAVIDGYQSGAVEQAVNQALAS